MRLNLILIKLTSLILILLFLTRNIYRHSGFDPQCRSRATSCRLSLIATQYDFSWRGYGIHFQLTLSHQNLGPFKDQYSVNPNQSQYLSKYHQSQFIVIQHFLSLISIYLQERLFFKSVNFISTLVILFLWSVLRYMISLKKFTFTAKMYNLKLSCKIIFHLRNFFTRYFHPTFILKTDHILFCVNLETG